MYRWNIAQGYNEIGLMAFCGHCSSKSCYIKSAGLWDQAWTGKSSPEETVLVVWHASVVGKNVPRQIVFKEAV